MNIRSKTKTKTKHLSQKKNDENKTSCEQDEKKELFAFKIFYSMGNGESWNLVEKRGYTVISVI